MHFSWLGSTMMKIQTKHDGKDITVVIDPYKANVGSSPRSLTPNMAIFTRGEKDSITLSGTPFVLSTAGEIEADGVLVSAAAGREAGTTVVRLDAEDISVGHLGLTKEVPNKTSLDVLTGVDILCLPVGSDNALSVENAMKVVSIVEPRIIIPIAFKSDNDPKAKDASAFLKEIGSAAKPEKKVIIKKRDLPQEETIVHLLEKE